MKLLLPGNGNNPQRFFSLQKGHFSPPYCRLCLLFCSQIAYLRKC